MTTAPMGGGWPKSDQRGRLRKFGTDMGVWVPNPKNLADVIMYMRSYQTFDPLTRLNLSSACRSGLTTPVCTK